ncbi:MAG: LuxR C-terminal-related transcriptional regulator [Muribaculum sp.]|nr:LuxR C-terminal-related transcriptional regulator [Muribaculum sp.]
MKHFVICTFGLSAVVESGIYAIIGKIKPAVYSVHRIDPARLNEQLSRLQPSIILADPVNINCVALTEIREALKLSTRLIGLQISALPKQTTDTFDAIISVYDTAQTIEEVIVKLASEKEEKPLEEESKALSQREKDVVIGIAKGLSNKEIATIMNVSVNTVMTHRRNISAKLKIHSPAGITIYAIVSKLIKLEDIKTQLP